MRSIGTMPADVRYVHRDARSLQRKRQRVHVEAAPGRAVDEHGGALLARRIFSEGELRTVAGTISAQRRQAMLVDRCEGLREGGIHRGWAGGTEDEQAGDHAGPYEDIEAEAARQFLHGGHLSRQVASTKPRSQRCAGSASRRGCHICETVIGAVRTGKGQLLTGAGPDLA